MCSADMIQLCLRPEDRESRRAANTISRRGSCQHALGATRVGIVAERCAGRETRDLDEIGGEIHTLDMSSTASISALQDDASGVVRQAEAEGIVPISRNGRTVAFVVSREKFSALLETMELQKNSELMGLVRQDKAGKVRFSPVPDEI